MAEGDKKFTAQDVNNLVQKRLDRQKAKYADYDTIKTENEGLRAAHASLKAENTELKSQIETQGGKLKDSELKAQRTEIAKKAGLPEGLIDRLQGETEEELLADAKRLAESLGPGPAVGSGTAPPGGPKRPLTRAEVKAMKPEEITANWPQISAQLKDGSLSRG